MLFVYLHALILTFMASKNVFHSKHGNKLIKLQNFLHFPDKKCSFTQNFDIQPYIFWFPKFLELFFTPKNTPPKVKNSKPDKSNILFGTPCRLYFALKYSLDHSLDRAGFELYKLTQVSYLIWTLLIRSNQSMDTL